MQYHNTQTEDWVCVCMYVYIWAWDSVVVKELRY